MSAVRGYAGWRRCVPAGGFALDFRARGVELSEADFAVLTSRVETALDRVVDRIAEVRLRIADVNGPKGGEDKRCSIRVRLGKLGVVRVAATASTTWEAVSRCLRAARRSCHERVARRAEHRRRSVVRLSGNSLFG